MITEHCEPGPNSMSKPAYIRENPGVWKHYKDVCNFGSQILKQWQTNREQRDTFLDLSSYPYCPMTIRWIEYFFNIAKVVAQQSKDPSTKVGCVLTNFSKQIIATGYNGFPINIDDDPKYYEDRECKLKYVVHAEANAICQCTANGHSTFNASAFITLQPCHECAKLLIQAGIQRVFYMKDTRKTKRQTVTNDWRDNDMLGVSMLSDAKISVFECEYINDCNGKPLLMIKQIFAKTDLEDPTNVLKFIDKNMIDDVINIMYQIQLERLSGKEIKHTKKNQAMFNYLMFTVCNIIDNETERRRRVHSKHTDPEYHAAPTRAAYAVVRTINNALDEYLQRNEGYVPELNGITIGIKYPKFDEPEHVPPMLHLTYEDMTNEYDIGLC